MEVNPDISAEDFELPEEWNRRDRTIFDGVYDYMIENQEIFTHPAQAPLVEEYWKTICWNAAWIAAEESFHYELKESND